MTEKLLDKGFERVDENLQTVRENIAQAAVRSGRNPEDIKLMAVTKTVEPEYINFAISRGIDLIGENKVQEFMSKKEFLNLENCKAHLIGHLQTNKVKKIIGEVDMIQSLDSLHLAQEISDRSAALGIVTDVLIEVNIGGEECKTGLELPKLEELIYAAAQMPGLKVRGLMTVPPFSEDSEQTRRFFANMYKLFIDMRSKKIDNISMDILSMGMSGDYCQAIEEGSTLVRVGSAIFGNRRY